MMKTCAGLLLAFCLLAVGALAQDAAPASNDDEPAAVVGARPYEMDWAGRTEPAHPQLVDFENLDGWRVRCLEGAQANAYRSKQEMLFGDYTLKAVYSGKSAASVFVIEPLAPIPIPGPFTAVDLWVRGNNWGWVNPPETARVGIRMLVRDAKDQDYRIDLGVEDFDYWSLMHATCVSPAGKKLYEPLGAGNDGAIDFPARFMGIEISGCSNEKPARLYLDALSFYEMQYPPLTFDKAPELLPWPTTPDTILPTFTHPESGLIMIADPGDGTLSGLTVLLRGQKFQPCHKGSIVFDIGGKEVRPGDPGVTTTVVNSGFANTRQFYEYELTYADTSVNYSYTIETRNSSFIIDIASSGGAAAGFDIGLAKGLKDPKTVFVPYLTYGNDWPKVVCSSVKSVPIFLLSVLDYYNSDASELFGAPRLKDADAVRYAGGAIYNRKTDGKRNDLHERLFVNISGIFDEVLPNIPNPNADTIDVAKEYLWRNIGPNFQDEMLAKYKAYGIDKFIACHHEVGWREAGESFTMRDRTAPGIGDEKVIKYSEFVRSLGYRFGTYTNYVDYAPVNANWDENNVCLTPDGEWQKAWPRNYALKPLRAVEKEAFYAPRIHEKFGTGAQYCDVQTAYTPWGRTDYDARTPGAGMFKTQFNAFARLLQNESKAHGGPVFSEGNYHWFYAGIVDGNYATMVPYGEGWKLPQIVDFDLLKMHTKMTDFGMGMPNMYFGFTGEWTKDKSRLSPWFDRFIAATVAFGHIGFLPDEWGFDGTLKAYYMLQALQQRYTGVPVKSIQYFDGEKLVDTSTAIATDAYKRGQICTQYENGLTTWCNLSFDTDWKVDTAPGIIEKGNSCVLPPGSFIAYTDGGTADPVLAYSATINAIHETGHRCDYVRCHDYVYVDTRGELLDKRQNSLELSTRGSVVLKHESKDVSWLIPTTSSEEVTFNPMLFRPDDIRHFSVKATAFGANGNVLGSAETRQNNGSITLMPLTTSKEPVLKYRLERLDSKDERLSLACHFLGCGTDKCVVGKSAEILAQLLPAPQDSDLQVSCALVRQDGTETQRTVAPLVTKQVPGWNGSPEPKLFGKATFQMTVPADAPLYSRCWFKCQLMKANVVSGEPSWADLTALPAFEISYASTTKIGTAQKKIGITGTIKNSFSKYEKVLVTLQEGEGSLNQSRTYELMPWETKGIDFETAPVSTGCTRLLLRAESEDATTEKVAFLSVTPTQWVVAELTKLPFDRGQCMRGAVEMPYDPAGTMAMVDTATDVVGGEAMDTLFTHPPYKGGVGYCFAAFNDVALPEGHPKLDFCMGFRTGCTTHDGCTFKAVVIADGKEAEVFSENYAALDKWARRSADLGAFAGKTVKLKLITDVGPNDDSYSDWALWGNPRVVMDEAAYKVELLPEKPVESSLPPPEPLANMTRADFGKIVSAKLTLDTAGVNGNQYTSYVYVNGVKIGATPESPDTAFHACELPLTKDAIATLGPVNTVLIKNPGQDFMKVRSLCLRFELEDGRRGSSTVDIGPYTGGAGWEFEEGKSVPVGEDLPASVLMIAVAG